MRYRIQTPEAETLPSLIQAVLKRRTIYEPSQSEILDVLCRNLGDLEKFFLNYNLACNHVNPNFAMVDASTPLIQGFDGQTDVVVHLDSSKILGVEDFSLLDDYDLVSDLAIITSFRKSLVGAHPNEIADAMRERTDFGFYFID